MIRRRSATTRQPRRRAPTPPAGVSGEPALGSPPAVPTGDADEPPSAAVLDELLAVFGAERAHHAAAPSGRRHRARGAGRRRRRRRRCRSGERSEARSTGLGGRRPHDVDQGDERRRARRQRPGRADGSSCGDPVGHGRPRHAGARGHEALDAPVAAGDAQGGRNGRPSAGRHAKEQAKQERKAAKAARKGGSPTAEDIDPGEGIRIVPADPARPSPPAPPGAAAPSTESTSTAAGGRTVTVIAADDLPDPSTSRVTSPRPQRVRRPHAHGCSSTTATQPPGRWCRSSRPRRPPGWSRACASGAPPFAVRPAASD